MSTLRLPTFQNFLKGNARRLLRPQQRRWAQQHDVRFLASHRDPQQILEKYRQKLDQKAKEEGLDSIESLKEAYKDKISEHRRKASTITTPEPPTSETSTIVSDAPPSYPATSSPVVDAVKATTEIPGIKPLSSFLNVEKILALPPKEIDTLWRLRHANNPRSICAVIPLDTYQRMASAARSHPQFILPLPRRTVAVPENASGESATVEGGADIHFLQWGFHPPTSPPTAASSVSPSQMANTHTSTIVFTHLEAYKLHGSFAPPHTTITHHLDLADDKGLVLMHGQVMPDQGVSTAEGSWLVSCVQRFYDFDGEGSGRKGELLRMFSRGDVEGFRIQDLVEETESIS